MIKGLSITPPLLGRIAIGKVVEKNGRRLPEKDDAFTITTQVQQQGEWMLHPLHLEIQQQQGTQKLRSIPVTLLFNDPELNLRADYSAFDRETGRPLCVGNGETAKRLTKEGYQSVPCPGPQLCPFGQEARCKPYGRLNVQVEGQEDPLGSFLFRTTGYNSIRTLTARLRYWNALSQGFAKYLPLSLKLRAKSTTQSHRAPIYYVDLTLREGVDKDEALGQAQQEGKLHQAEDQALEVAARLGLANGPFEETEEEAEAVAEEFFPEGGMDRVA
ncbi:hypothetical protein [Candidatus Igneacidithiobacillus taiwanensis]|uniref:recombination directionality factor n=1 Tax=Candidatus Igneacidithiobacillus taiwanensis TaxID=1945924 RepID=UPI00289EB84A|nr:hypothetical protein [Candidatus Igneacidithiobacillus taiwanensis]